MQMESSQTSLLLGKHVFSSVLAFLCQVSTSNSLLLESNPNSPKSAMRQLTFLACFLLSFMAAGCSLFKTRYEEIPPRFPDSISVLEKTDPDWKFRSLSGDTIRLGDFRGRRLFINFWATWCAPCLAEMPGLQTLFDSKKADSTLVFLFITDEDERTVHSFLSKTSYTLPFYLCDRERSPVFNSGAYPSTFILNSRGEIVFRKLQTAKVESSNRC